MAKSSSRGRTTPPRPKLVMQPPTPPAPPQPTEQGGLQISANSDKLIRRLQAERSKLADENLVLQTIVEDQYLELQDLKAKFESMQQQVDQIAKDNNGSQKANPRRKAPQADKGGGPGGESTQQEDAPADRPVRNRRAASG